MFTHKGKQTALVKLSAVVAAIALADIVTVTAASASPVASSSIAAAHNGAHGSTDKASVQQRTTAKAALGRASGISVAGSPVASEASVARPKPGTLTASYFRIINQASGKCLTPWGTGDGTAITQVACNGSANQWWLLDPGSVGPISNYGTGKCLDLWGNGSGDAQLVFTWTCYGANSQRWRAVNAGSQYYELHPYYTDKCLDLANGVPNDGAIIQQWGCHAFNNNQHWWLG